MFTALVIEIGSKRACEYTVTSQVIYWQQLEKSTSCHALILSSLHAELLIE